MGKERYRIAIASSDGIVVNSHFGRAKKFYLYEADDDEDIRFLEIRNVKPVCNGGNHNDNELKENILKFIDCRYLLVSRIGSGASQMAENYGIEAYEIPGEIEESIKQLIKYKKVKDLLR